MSASFVVVLIMYMCMYMLCVHVHVRVYISLHMSTPTNIFVSLYGRAHAHLCNLMHQHGTHIYLHVYIMICGSVNRRAGESLN